MAATAPAAALSSSDTATDGPVLSVVNKRLRALRKKLNRITQMEESLSQGKALNKEQEETLRSKSSVLAGIDELEKLRQPLLQAVGQEIERTVENIKQKPDNADAETPIQAASAIDANTRLEATMADSKVSDLLNLLYFSTVFDVKTLLWARDNMLTRTHERNCCLTYDCITDDDAAGDLLKEPDLDSIATLGGLLVSRSVNSSLSHMNALQNCFEHAKLWLANSDKPIEPNSNITYAGLREKLNKIMTSEYFTTAPEIKDAIEVAAAGSTYASFQMPAQGSTIPPVGTTIPVEDYTIEYKQEEEQPVSHDADTYVHEPVRAQEYNQGVPEAENTHDIPAQTEQAQPVLELDQNSRGVVDLKEQNAARKPYPGNRGSRGGSRRGYTNGSGGRGGGSRGGYHNGRGQFDDGYYQQRSSSGYRGRGGRGMNGDYNHGGSGGHAHASS